MKRNKYINTFDNTSDFNNYIESAEPGFPNVALTKDTGNVHYNSTDPKNFIIYGELIDDYNGTPPQFKFNNNNNQKVTAHIDTANNTFYVEASDMTGITTPITALNDFSNGQNNIKSIKKLAIDKISNSSNITNIQNCFRDCSNLEYINIAGLNTINVTNTAYMFISSSKLKTIDISGCDFSNVSTNIGMFNYVNNLKDIYITVEATLNLLTNNLVKGIIPTSATIHYNGTDYKWQNNAWTPQS